jgi:hypothetical protein
MPRFRGFRVSVLALLCCAAWWPVACGTSGSQNSGGSNGSGGSGAGHGSGGNGASHNSGGSGGTGIIVPDGGGGQSFNPDAGCATADFSGKLIPANLLFVIDRSGSMNCNLPPTTSSADCEKYPVKADPSQPSKWELTEAALENAITELEQSPNVSAGVSMFPVAGSDCNVQPNGVPNVAVAKLDATQAQKMDNFLGQVSPGGDTPLAGATILSYAYLQSQHLPGNSFVVLLTDGYETCSPGSLPNLLNQDVPNALKIGIRTFAIGVPGSENSRALLSQVAWLGGTPRDPNCDHSGSQVDVGDCHFDMTTSQNFATDLANALKAISGTVLTCEFDLPKPDGGAVDPNKVNVTVNGQLVQQDNKPCGQAQGWQYNANKTKIELCGTPCTQVEQQSAPVKIVLGCPTGEIH